MPSITRPELKKNAYRLLAILFWLAVWQVLALAVGQEFLLASPLAVLSALIRLLSLGTSYQAFLHSTLRILLGFLSALVLALLCAPLASRFRLFDELLSPLITLARAVPVTSFVILAIILVSSRWLSAFIAFVIGFPILYSNVREGLQGRDKGLNEMSQVFMVPWHRKLLLITLPQLHAHLRVGLVTALGLCWKSGIAAEVIGIPSGSIGERLYSVKVNYNTAELFAWTAFIVLLSALSIRLFTFLLEQGFKRLYRL